MGEQNHTRLLRLQAADLAGRTPFCPEDQVIADYYDGGLAGSERDNLERHLGDCRFCRARIGIIERLERGQDHRRIPESTLAKAKQIATLPHRRHLRAAPAWAAAAVLVIAMAGIITNRQVFMPDTGPAPTTRIPDPDATRQLRSVNRNAGGLQVLAPAPGAEISPGATLRWAEVSDRLYYDIAVLSHEGDVLLTRRTQDSQWALDDSVLLEAGGKYYFRVEARLPDGRTVKSRHVEFRAGEQ